MALGDQVQQAAQVAGVARIRAAAAARAQQAAIAAQQAAVAPAAVLPTAPGQAVQVAQQAQGVATPMAQQAAQQVMGNGAPVSQFTPFQGSFNVPGNVAPQPIAPAPVQAIASPMAAAAPPSAMASNAAAAANPAMEGASVTGALGDVTGPALPAAEGAAAATGKLGALKSILSYQPRTALGMDALQASEGSVLPEFLQAGSLGGGLALAGGGIIAGNLAEGLIGHKNGSVDDAAVNAIRGGGIGAGLGSMFLPGPGTLVGGLAGAAAGGIYGAITGKDSDRTEGQRALAQQLDPTHGGSFAHSLSVSGLSPYAQQQLLVQLQASSSLVGSKADAKQLITSAAQNIPAIQLQDQQYQMSQAKAAAMQSYLGPLLQQSYGNTNNLSQQSQSLTNAAANATQDPALAAAYRAQGASTAAAMHQSQSAQIAALYGQVMAPQAQQQVQQAYAGHP